MLNKIYDEFADLYGNAIYVVKDSRTIKFKIGKLPKAMTEFLSKHQTKQASLITACNPRGIKQGIDLNRNRMALLEQDIQELKLPYFQAYGASNDESWLEDSFLVLGITQIKANELGTKYEQNAIVWINETNIASLVWMD